MVRVFKDRRDAGVQLARALHPYAEAPDAVVLAHAKNSVPVAYEVATRLALPLDLYGAELDDMTPNVDVDNKVVLLVDDGDTARELPRAIEALRVEGAASVIAAVAVASPPIWALLLAAADHVACVLTPQHLFSIEAWYADLAEPSDSEVRQLLVTATQNLLLLRRSNFLTRNVDT